jgi:hypothetical protein
MSYNLKGSNRVKKEINKFKKEIDSITFPEAKEKGLNLLNKLSKQINIVEESHTFQIKKSVDPKKLKENAEELMNIRLELFKLIKDAKS